MSSRFLAGTLLLAMTASACWGSGDGSESVIGTATSFNVVTIPPAEREPAPAFSGERLRDGTTIDQGILAGKVGVVNFWGSWCGPCRREQPELEALWQEYGPRGVQFLGVNTRRDQKAAALAYVEEFSVSYPSIYDPPSRIAFSFGVRVMPATFVIDRQGRVSAHIIGALRNQADLRILVDRELSE